MCLCQCFIISPEIMGGQTSKQDNSDVKQVLNNQETSTGTHFIEVNIHGPTLAFGAFLLLILIVVACLAPRCGRFLALQWRKDKNRGRRGDTEAYYHFTAPPSYRHFPKMYYHDQNRFEEIVDHPIYQPSAPVQTAATAVAKTPQKNPNQSYSLGLKETEEP